MDVAAKVLGRFYNSTRFLNAARKRRSEMTRRETELETQDKTLQKKFRRLATEWKEETAHLSSVTKMVMHPKYQNIIGMGPAILPFLFRELQKNPDHWFWALQAITGEDPTRPEDSGNLSRMTGAWLEWARWKGYV